MKNIIIEGTEYKLVPIEKQKEKKRWKINLEE